MTRQDKILKDAQIPKPSDVLRKYMGGDSSSFENFSHAIYEITGDNNGPADAVTRLKLQKDAVVFLYSHPRKMAVLSFKGDNSAYEIVNLDSKKEEISLRPLEHSPNQITADTNLSLHSYFSSHKLLTKYSGAVTNFKHDSLREARAISREQAQTEYQGSIAGIMSKLRRGAADKKVRIPGISGIEKLLEEGCLPGLADNPRGYVYSEEEVPLLVHKKNGYILVFCEHPQAITEKERKQYVADVKTSKDKDFEAILKKFDQSPSKDPKAEFLKGIDILTTYPEELKKRTRADLDEITAELGGMLDEKTKIDKGAIPFEAFLEKKTYAVLDYVMAGMPHSEKEKEMYLLEVRKTLDWMEYTSPTVKTEYKESVAELVAMEIEGMTLYNHLKAKDLKSILDIFNRMPKQRRETINVKKIVGGLPELQDEQFKNEIYAGIIALSNRPDEPVKLRKKTTREETLSLMHHLPEGNVTREDIREALSKAKISDATPRKIDAMINRLQRFKEFVKS